MKVKRLSLCLHIVMLLVAAIAVTACGNKIHTMQVEDGVVKMDGKPYIVASAEID